MTMSAGSSSVALSTGWTTVGLDVAAQSALNADGTSIEFSGGTGKDPRGASTTNIAGTSVKPLWFQGTWREMNSRWCATCHTRYFSITGAAARCRSGIATPPASIREPRREHRSLTCAGASSGSCAETGGRARTASSAARNMRRVIWIPLSAIEASRFQWGRTAGAVFARASAFRHPSTTQTRARCAERRRRSIGRPRNGWP